MDWRLLEQCDSGSLDALNTFQELLEKRGLNNHLHQFVVDLIKKRTREATLHFQEACHYGNLTTAHKLAPYVNVLESNSLALRDACDGGHLKIVELLISLDALWLTQEATQEAHTALRQAVFRKHHDIVLLMVDNGVKIGLHLFALAEKWGSKDTIKFLDSRRSQWIGGY